MDCSNKLTYPNQLQVDNVIHDGNQFDFLVTLINTGLPSNEAVNMFRVVRSSVILSNDQKQFLLTLMHDKIINPDIINQISQIIN